MDKVVYDLHINDHIDLNNLRVKNKPYPGIWTIRNLGSADIKPGKSPDEDKISIVTVRPKAVIEMMYGFYPFITSILKTIVDFYSVVENRDRELILLTQRESKVEDFRTFERFIFRYLEDIGVRYKIICTNSISEKGVILKSLSVEVNDFVKLSTADVMMAASSLYEPTRVYTKNINDTANRKVFISRRFAGREDSRIERRTLDHQKIESIFSGLGFEIVYTEDFADFADQIDFFDKVSVLAGITGAGMSNMVFMRPGSRIVHLINPVSFTSKDENGNNKIIKELHLIYNTMSFFKDHRILNINNRFNPQELEEDNNLLDLIRRFSE